MIDASSYNQNGQIANDTSHNASKKKKKTKFQVTKRQNNAIAYASDIPWMSIVQKPRKVPIRSKDQYANPEGMSDHRRGDPPPFFFCFERNKKHTNPWSSSWITVWTVRTTQRTKNLLYFHRTRSRERHQHNTRNPDGS